MPRSVGFRADGTSGSPLGVGSWELGVVARLRFSASVSNAPRGPADISLWTDIPSARSQTADRCCRWSRENHSGIAPNRELIGLHESCTTADCPGLAVTPRR